MNKEFVFGKNSVEALLLNSERPINKIFILSSIKKDSKIHTILKLANNNKIPVSEISKEKMSNMLKENVNHQGIVASVSPVNFSTVDEILETVQHKKKLPLLILLDNIEDPQNLGAIIRSSEVLGADGIIIPKRRSAIISGTVAKASSGALEFIPIARVNNLNTTIKTLKEQGLWVIGAENEIKSQNIFHTDFNIPCAIVMGSEGKGISPLVKKSCDILIKIPQSGKTTSLNVSNALSIVLYEITRQRTNK